jgi:hypothetical protein
MILKTLAAVGLILAVAAAPAYAFGGKRGGGNDGGVALSSSFASSGAPADDGPVTSASEPLTALAVGLGLLGARFLRRR